MPRYSVAQAPYGEGEAFVLHDEEAGVEARVCPAIGCNVYRFTALSGDREIDLIEAPAEAEALRAAPTGHGIPVMIPYPGRVRNGRFQFGGRTIALPLADGRGHAIHGCVRQRSWRVIAAETNDCASVACSIGTSDFPEMLGEWPWPLEVAHTTSLRAGALTISLQVTNRGQAPMPLGVGLHPYFRAPLGPVGDRDRCLVQVEATHWWEQEQAFPTGRIEELSGLVDLRAPRPIGDLPAKETPRGSSVNELYSRFGPAGSSPLADTGVRASVTDPALGLRVRITTSDTFRALVLFTPPWAPSVSPEPHTCVPDAFNVTASGIECGLIVLDPGETWAGWARFEAETAG